MAVAIILIVLVLLVIYVVSTYNNLVALRNKVDEAFSTMDVYLKKRWDLIPNLVETTKGYAKHESETLENVIAARNKPYASMTSEEKLDANKELSRSIPSIMALAESYPDLKANTNFMQLSSELTSLEDDIANSRKYYNAVIRNYNNKVQMVPSNIVASMFGFKPKANFEIIDAQRENVEVKF